MWIRSQDKTELITSHRIQADCQKIFAFDTGNDDSWVKIGEYITDKRALEVLDEIQIILTQNSDINIYAKHDAEGFCVEKPKTKNYEMPKE